MNARRLGPAAAGRRPAEPRSASAPELVGSGFFALRTPLLPFEELEAFGGGLEAAAAAAATVDTAVDDPARLDGALARDRERLRARLRELLARPEIAEAVFLASPSLAAGLAAWQSDPSSRKGRRAECALVRYFLRMTARATPFGLFSGCSVGRLGGSTCLRLAPRASYRRHTRLDMDYLFALAEDLGRDPQLRGQLLYRPNSSLYRCAGRWRYAEARLDGKTRSHHLVAIEATRYLDLVLERAAAGARAEELAAALVADDSEISLDEAAGFLAELIDCQLLVSDLSPPVSGPEAIHDLVGQLSALPAGRAVAGVLDQTRCDLDRLDAGGLGASPDRYRELAGRLEGLPTAVELSRLFQVDMVKPGGGLELGAEPVAELRRGVEMLHRLAGRPRQDPFERFRKDFADRYGEGRWVPLAEALDEEVGIGFQKSEAAHAEASPLLDGIVLPFAAEEPSMPPTAAARVLMRKLEEALSRSAHEIALEPADLERMAEGGGEPPPLPDAFQVMATIVAASEEDVAAGRFRLLWRGASGPSGARLLGRFCHADAELAERVAGHLASEEELQPGALFAELVHLPQGRIGNILARPLLRSHEIPFLGRSGAPGERQIPITDLRVTVLGPRIVLRSERLGRQVVPRLTSAHNFVTGSLGLYRFLCSLQSQGVAEWLGWSWGSLETAAFLPRVTTGRLVLARARWRMGEPEIQTLAGAREGARFSAVARWRRERRLPRWVAHADGDNELAVDLDNALALDGWLDLLGERKEALLFELFPAPEELCARGPEGRFLHELLVPFVRAGRAEAALRPVAAPAVMRGGRSRETPVPRSFPPGSEWLYAKLYTGSSTADALLREVVAPVVRQALACGACDGWFFIRYGDPQWHLRLRLHGDPARLHAEVLPELQRAAAAELEWGKLWRFQLDTYDRELERYGGPHGIGLAERLFHCDSEAALEILELIEGDEGADARWRLAFLGVELLLADLGLDAAEKASLLGRLSGSFRREFARDAAAVKGLRVQLDQKLRAERRSLEALLDPAEAAAGPLAPGFEILTLRSRRIAALAPELHRLWTAGELTTSPADLASSFVHMHVNRMIRSAARAHELVLYEMLAQVYASRSARARVRDPLAAASIAASTA
jgi:thiopeptide-type bacteriocin biosynthesis protein